MKNTRNLMAAAMMLATLANGVVPAMAAKIDVSADINVVKGVSADLSSAISRVSASNGFLDYIDGTTFSDSFRCSAANGPYMSVAVANSGDDPIDVKITYPDIDLTITDTINPGRERYFTFNKNNLTPLTGRTYVTLTSDSPMNGCLAFLQSQNGTPADTLF